MAANMGSQYTAEDCQRVYFGQNDTDTVERKRASIKKKQENKSKGKKIKLSQCVSVK